MGPLLPARADAGLAPQGVPPASPNHTTQLTRATQPQGSWGDRLVQHGRTGREGPKERLDGQSDPARRVNIRELFRNREFIKITAYLLPRRTKILVLEMMERLRQERMPRRRKPASDKDVRLPEMTGGELVREINWRIGTLPPGDAEHLALYIRHLTRWRVARARERSRENATPAR